MYAFAYMQFRIRFLLFSGSEQEIPTLDFPLEDVRMKSRSTRKFLSTAALLLALLIALPFSAWA
jgi:hypothetical protein